MVRISNTRRYRCHRPFSLPQLVSDALSYTSEMTKEGDRIDFVWPVAPRGLEATLELVQEWKERRVQEKGEHSIGSSLRTT